MRLHKWDGGIQDHWYEDSPERGSRQGRKLPQLATHHRPGLSSYVFPSFEHSILDWNVLLHRHDTRASGEYHQGPLCISDQGNRKWNWNSFILFLTLFRTAASQWLELPLGMLAIWRKPCTMSPSNLLFINLVYCPPSFNPDFYLQSSSCLLYPQVNWTPALPESRSSLTAPLFKTISLLNIYQDHQLYSSMIKNGRAYLQAMKLLVIYMPWHCHGKFCCNTMCLKNKSLCDSFKIVVCEVAASCWQGITVPNCRSM